MKSSGLNSLEVAKNNQIYIKPVGGLCNRMRTIDSCVSLASELNKQLTVIWGRDGFLNCKFSDLFQPHENFHVIEESQSFGRKALFPYLPGSRPTSLLKRCLYKFTKSVLGIEKEIWFEDFDDALSPLRKFITPLHIKNMRDYENKSLNYLAPFVTEINRPGNTFLCSAWRLNSEQNYRHCFVPVEQLNYKVTEVTRKFNHTIGIHIRRTDHNISIRNSLLGKFIEAMNNELKQHSSCSFFLATDCKKTENELKKIYHDKIITFGKDSYSRNSTLGIQDALVDLYCLSKTDKVLGSYFSSFSQVAAEISGIEEHTIY